MSDDRIERILDAAYACFARHGVRRTTMDDIAAAAEMSRPAVYQYVRNKDDAFRRLATRLFDTALARAGAAAAAGGPLADRLHRVLAVKLELTLQLRHDSPHAAELLDAGARLSGELVERFTGELRELAAGTVAEAAARGEVTLGEVSAVELADIALALAKGLEADPSGAELPRQRLQRGVLLLVAGVASVHGHVAAFEDGHRQDDDGRGGQRHPGVGGW